MDYWQLSLVVATIAPQMISITPTDVTWYAVLNIGKTLFSIPLAPEDQDQCSFMQQGLQYAFAVLPWGYLRSPDICLQGGGLGNINVSTLWSLKSSLNR